MRQKWQMLVLILLVALGIGFVDSSISEASKGQVTVALVGEPTTMDPHRATGNIETSGWRMAFDPLVNIETGTGKKVPWLAERWELLDPKRVKFYLRKGVKFSDGSPLTSAAVKFSIERVFDKATRSPLKRFFKTFKKIEILDDHTFIWHLKKPDNGLFNTLYFRPLIMSPKIKDWDLAKISVTPVGTGPYILKSWTKGQKMVFEANPNWWADKEYPNRPKVVVLRRIRESTTRVKALLRGEVDAIQGVTPHFIKEIRNDKNAEVAASLSTRILMVSFMSRHGGPFGDLNVRRAVNHAVNIDEIRNTFLPGLTKPIGQLFHPWSFSGYNPNKKWYGFDLAKAKEYMKKSKYAKGFKATFYTSANRLPADKQTCEAIPAQLLKINIETQCRPLTWRGLQKTMRTYQKGKKKDPAMFLLSLGNPTGNPYLGGSNQTSCKGRNSLHCFKDLDAAFDKANTTIDPNQQQKEWEKVTDLIKEKATHKILYNVSVIYGYRKDRVKMTPRQDEVFMAWEIEMN